MCNSKSWMLQALDIVLIVDMAVCYKCVRWTLDILPIFMLLGFAEKCVLLCHLCPQRFSRPRRSPNAFGLGQMQKGKTHPTQGRRRSKDIETPFRPSDVRWSRLRLGSGNGSTECRNLVVFRFFVNIFTMQDSKKTYARLPHCSSLLVGAGLWIGLTCKAVSHFIISHRFLLFAVKRKKHAGRFITAKKNQSADYRCL